MTESAPHNHTPTSKAAAESIVPVLGRLQAMILAHYQREKYRGATCDEVEAALGLKHQTCSARIRELRDKGLLVDSGYQRKTRSGRKAAVMVVPAFAPKDSFSRTPPRQERKQRSRRQQRSQSNSKRDQMDLFA